MLPEFIDFQEDLGPLSHVRESVRCRLMNSLARS